MSKPDDPPSSGRAWRRVPLNWWRRSGRWPRVLFLSSVVGIFSGLAAAGLEALIEFGTENQIGKFTHLDTTDYLRLNWGVLMLPIVGSLVAGVIVYAIFKLKPGHGTNLLTRAFHRDMGVMPLKGPLVKALATPLVMMCGGSVGPEGPIAALGSALGSTLGQKLGISAQERRTLLVAGCAAGVGAMFRCPLGGALFATGILYSDTEFESDALVPSVVASVWGFSTYMLFWGFGEPMLKNVQQLAFHSPKELIPYAVLGPVCGGVSIFFSLMLRSLEKRLDRMPSKWWWCLPIIGGVVTGLLACALPQIMDGRFAFIQKVLDGHIWDAHPDMTRWGWALFFGMIVIAKCIATSVTVGTGTPGGVLGPAVFIGGATGAFVGTVIWAISPSFMPELLREAMIPVGMAGVLAATMRMPIASTVMVAEMTGGYGLIVPLMFVSAVSYIVGRRWGVNHEQVRTTADSPAHAADQVVHVLESWLVEQFTVREWPARVGPEATLFEIKELLKPGTFPVIAVVKDNELVGLISVTDIAKLDRQTAGDPRFIIADDIMTRELVHIYEDENLYEALGKFERHRHRVLPVYRRDHQGELGWVGMLPRERVAEALQRHMDRLTTDVLREHEILDTMNRDAPLNSILAPLPRREDRLRRLMVPTQALGKSLREADFRKAYNLEVVAIELDDGSVLCPPDPNLPLDSYHRLLVLSSKEPGPAAAAVPVEGAPPSSEQPPDAPTQDKS